MRRKDNKIVLTCIFLQVSLLLFWMICYFVFISKYEKKGVNFYNTLGYVYVMATTHTPMLSVLPRTYASCVNNSAASWNAPPSHPLSWMV